MAEATMPPGMRWIPKGMSVEYLSKAVGVMRAVAAPEVPLAAGAAAGQEWPVLVQITDSASTAVFRARITMWISPRKL